MEQNRHKHAVALLCKEMTMADVSDSSYAADDSDAQANLPLQVPMVLIDVVDSRIAV